MLDEKGAVVAQVSQPAVSPISKSAKRATECVCGFGNPRYSRLGGLRYAFAASALGLARQRPCFAPGHGYDAPIRFLVGITAKQFEQMKSRVSGRGRVPGAVFESSAVPMSHPHRIILGIDPSLRGTGFGIIRVARPQPELLAQGTIKSPAGWERSRCLLNIARTLRELLKDHHPSVCVVEGLFYAQNLQTALIMGEARGASLVAVAEAGMEIYEIAPRKVKQAVVGYGAAQKTAVAKMVQRMLRLPVPPSSDAADALALALAYAQENGRYSFRPPKRI